MDTTIFLWTLAATFFAGLQTFVGKVVAHEKRDAAFNGIFTYGIAVVIGLAVLLWRMSLPQGWPFMALFGIMAGGIHGVSNYIRIESLKHVDSVIFFPINKVLGPVLAVLSGIILFSETLSVKQFLGIALSLTVPLLLVSSAEHHRQNDLRTGLRYLFLSTVLAVIAIVFSKQAFAYGTDVMFVLLMTQAAGFLVSTAIFTRNNGHVFAVASMPRRDRFLGILAGAFGFLAYFTFLQALIKGYLSLVYVIHAHYILIPIILSVWLHKDHINVRKLAAVAVSSLAIILLYSA